MLTRIRVNCIEKGFDVIPETGEVVKIDDIQSYTEMVEIHTGLKIKINELYSDDDAVKSALDIGFSVDNKGVAQSLNGHFRDWKRIYFGLRS